MEPAKETDCDADSAFLMEVMEINEKLAESKNKDNLEEVETSIKGRFDLRSFYRTNVLNLV